jgi:hypothetical protein
MHRLVDVRRLDVEFESGGYQQFGAARRCGSEDEADLMIW